MERSLKKKSKPSTSSKNSEEKEVDEDMYQIFVGGCHPETKKSDLEGYFSKFGRVKNVRLMKDKATGKNFILCIRQVSRIRVRLF